MGREDAAAVEAWCSHDAARGLDPADVLAVGKTKAARALVVELSRTHGAQRDLLNATSVLGRLLAREGASPSLLSATASGLDDVLRRADLGRERAASALAALVEGYVAVREELVENAARGRWEYPACAVPVGPDRLAIAAGYPEDDGEALADWAARVARGASRDGAKKVHLAGTPAASAALAEALEVMGVEVSVDPRDDAPRPPAWKGWLPWRGRRGGRSSP